jgi:hypothetical protein
MKAITPHYIDGQRSNQWDAGRSSGALGRFQVLGCRSRIRSIRNRGFS